LYRTTIADGSSISLAQYWNATHVGHGSVDLAGPRGEEMSLGAAAPVYRYVRRLPYMPANYVLQAPCCDPVRAYVALFPQIATTLTQRLGKPTQFLDRIVEYQPTAWPGGQAVYILSASRMGGAPPELSPGRRHPRLLGSVDGLHFGPLRASRGLSRRAARDAESLGVV